MKMNGYWVYTHTTPDNMVYVGMSGREYSCQRWKPQHYKGTSLEKEISLWGWENIDHKVIKDNLTKQEAQELEEEIRQFNEINGVSLNIMRSGGIVEKCGGVKEYDRIRNQSEERKEYYRLRDQSEERKEYKKQYDKKYFLEHKEERLKYLREWKRRYRENKKQEKQLKELCYITLF